MRKHLVASLTLVVLAPAAGVPNAVPRHEATGDLLVAAAASLSAIAPELARPFHDATGIELRFNFAASNTLARQIVEGAPVDVFISADAAQMDVVEHAGRLVVGSRIDLLSNQLVVVSRSGGRQAWPEALASPTVRRVAMGDPAAVPAGVYGRQWLETAGLWARVEPKIVPLPTSPAALAAVAAGRADAAIVYRTDAANAAAAQVVHLVDDATAPRIVYPAAAITGSRESGAHAFLAFLRGPAARRAFEFAGFRTVGVD